MNYFRLGSYMRFLILKEKFLAFQNKKIIDIGCNYGEIVKELAKNNQVIGVDTDNKALKIAKENIKNAKFAKASATDLPFLEESFDVVICLSVLEHIQNDQKALGEISRVLKNGGELILSVPNKKARLIPKWLGYLIRLINRAFKTNYPQTDEEYVHFGQEGIGHVHWGYSLQKIKRMLTKAQLIFVSYKTYWHFPTRCAYLLLMPLIKGGFLKENLAKVIFLPFFLLDKIFKDQRGDVLILAKKVGK